MLLSLKSIKRIESIKIELRLALKNLSDGIHGMYEGLLTSQHNKRVKRIEFAYLKKKKLCNEAIALIEKIGADTLVKYADLDNSMLKLHGEKRELLEVLTTIKKDGDPNA